MSTRLRTWLALLVVASVLAVVVNLSLTGLEVDHDAPLIALLVAASVTTVALTLAALETITRVPWLATRADSRPGTGEDTRTATFRRLVEIHETSRDADDAVLWQLAELARRRLRQVHGIRYADDPARVTELLGPVLADLLSRDRRHRYTPEVRHERHSVASLAGLVGRIEDL
jgi:hypothetical protein